MPFEKKPEKDEEEKVGENDGKLKINRTMTIPDDELKKQQQRNKSNKSKKKRREYLRVHQIDEYVEEYPERVFTAEMSRGDVLFFDQFTYHRGLPNVSPNRTRWSVDFRFQDVRVPTLRSDPGFVLGSDKAAQDAAIAASAPLIATEEDWLDARPSLRLSELNGAERNAAVGGHEWASRHIHNSELRGALDLEQLRHLGSREKSRL